MALYKDLNDYEVMYMIKENDQEAKDIIFMKYEPVVKKIASYYYKEAKNCGLDYDDLVQEGYLGIYKAINNYNSDEDTLFYTYAIHIVKNKIFNAIKCAQALKNTCMNQSISLDYSYPILHEQPLIELIEDKKAVLPLAKIQTEELETKIYKFLYELKFEYANAFELCINGFKTSEIALLLDLPIKKVQSFLFNSKKRLKSYLANY